MGNKDNDKTMQQLTKQIQLLQNIFNGVNHSIQQPQVTNFNEMTESLKKLHNENLTQVSTVADSFEKLDINNKIYNFFNIIDKLTKEINNSNNNVNKFLTKLQEMEERLEELENNPYVYAT